MGSVQFPPVFLYYIQMPCKDGGGYSISIKISKWKGEHKAINRRRRISLQGCHLMEEKRAKGKQMETIRESEQNTNGIINEVSKRWYASVRWFKVSTEPSP